MGVRAVVTVPGLRIQSLNVKEHWRARSRRVNAEKAAVALALAALDTGTAAALRSASKLSVRLVRLGGRKLDRDNVAAGFKGTLDAVCKWLQCDDGDEERLAIAWAQEPGGAYGVRIELTGNE